MSAVEFADLLDERATIKRAPTLTPSSSGVTRKTWTTTVATDVPTSVQRGSGRLVQTDAGQQVEASFKALVDYSTDVVAGDRLVVGSATYDVLLVYTVTSPLPGKELALAVATPGVA